MRDEAIERRGIQHAGDAFVIADAAQPAAARCAQTRYQSVGIVDVGRTAAHGRERCGERGDMDVMIVQAGQQQSASGIDHSF